MEKIIVEVEDKILEAIENQHNHTHCTRSNGAPIFFEIITCWTYHWALDLFLRRWPGGLQGAQKSASGASLLAPYLQDDVALGAITFCGGGGE
ncbi:hypothetical protein TKK_0010271 [Trichogramma kaykai]